MKSDNKHLLEKSAVAGLLNVQKTEVVLTMGAGDVDGIAGEIIEVLKAKEL